jgi:protein ImuB
MACVDVPALPLQILLNRHADWKESPVAVVDREKAQGTIQWVNEHARAQRILPGMRYTAGLSLAGNLRSGVVDEDEVQKTVAAILQRLWNFTPSVEPSRLEPGTFWLGTGGLQEIYPSLREWSALICSDLQSTGLFALVIVGFSRFGTYATAKAGNRNILFHDTQQERAFVRRVPLNRMRFEPAVRDTLLKLGIDTLGEFIDLPAGSIRRRFGNLTCELHRLATGDVWDPMSPHPICEPVRRTIMLDHPETNQQRLALIIKPLLQSMLQEFAARREVLISLHFFLLLDDKRRCRESLQPAAPTLDLAQLMSLLYLKIEPLALSSGITELTLRGAGIRATRQQLELFRQAQERSLTAIRRAFAEIRANMGHGSIMHARLHERHLPEATYSWEAIESIDTPQPAAVKIRPLVRRVYSRPIELRSRLRHEPDGWIVGRMADGPVEEVIGPHVVSGGWWAREVARAYYYVRTHNGRWFWIYQDQPTKRWFLQGEVE